MSSELVAMLQKESAAEIARVLAEAKERTEQIEAEARAAAQAVRELGLDAEVRGADDVRGGARVATPDRRFVVENTLASRIKRVRPLLAPEVAQLLWG